MRECFLNPAGPKPGRAGPKPGRAGPGAEPGRPLEIYSIITRASKEHWQNAIGLFRACHYLECAETLVCTAVRAADLNSYRFRNRFMHITLRRLSVDPKWHLVNVYTMAGGDGSGLEDLHCYRCYCFVIVVLIDVMC